MHVPRHLSAAVARGDIPRTWVAALPRALAEFTRRWGLTVGPPYEPGGQCSWVAAARDASGAALVLKLGWRHPDAEHEADGLRLWRGAGAVRLAGHATTSAETAGDTAVLLLERCEPGTSLSMAAEPDQDVVIAHLLTELWIEPPSGHPFRSLHAMCDAWADEFDAALARAPGAIHPALAREGMAIYRELPRTAERSVVLTTDLHAGNVLAARRRPWLAIDPKPHVGDPTYDPLQHMLNCPHRLAADPDGFVALMAALLDLDAGRLRLWLFARCVQECLDTPALAAVAARLAP